GSLADGRYSLTIVASKVTVAGVPLDGNCDGIDGDDFVFAGPAAPNPPGGIFRFFGDADGNGDVNATDFLTFSDACVGFAPYDPAIDFDNSGSVDAADFLQFRGRYLLGGI